MTLLEDNELQSFAVPEVVGLTGVTNQSIP